MTVEIEVVPETALRSRPRLFGSLATAEDVRFVPPGAATSPAGRVVFGDEPAVPGVPAMVLGAGAGEPAGPGPVAFTEADGLDSHLRGWSIPHPAIDGLATFDAVDAGEILATVAGRPVWVTGGTGPERVERAVAAPDELGADETLLGRLTPGSFFDLLPLVHFLRSLHPDRWSLPPVAASFIMDDPNLHATRYGYLDFAELAEAGFHMTLAMIPLDRWYSRRRTVELFLRHPEALSLMVHGNNHTHHELGDGRDGDARMRMLAQSLRRVRAFTAGTGVPVAEVMAAPHGRCSEESAGDMARLGFESLCISKPFPWTERPPASHPLAGWAPADTSTPLPMLPRMPLTAAREELPLRAFLRHPLILFGHHWDLAGDPHLLRRWAEDVARLGEVRWTSVGEISRGTYSWRVVGDTMTVRPHTRVVDVTVPEGAVRLNVEAPPGDAYQVVDVSGGSGPRRPDPDGAVTVGPDEKLTVRLRGFEIVDPDRVQDPRWSPWPIARRLLTEGRDRARPSVDRVRARMPTAGR